MRTASGCRGPGPRPLSHGERAQHGERMRREKLPQPCALPQLRACSPLPSLVWAGGGGCSSPRPSPAQGSRTKHPPSRARRCQPQRQSWMRGEAAAPAGHSAPDLGHRESPDRSWPGTCPTENPGAWEALGSLGGPEPLKAARRRCSMPSAPGTSAWAASGAHLPTYTGSPPQART